MEPSQQNDKSDHYLRYLGSLSSCFMETEANLHLQRVYTFASVYNKMNVTKTRSRLGKNIARLKHRRLMRVFRGLRFICGDAATLRCK